MSGFAVGVREALGMQADERWAARNGVRSCGEAVDAETLSASCESHAALGSARGTGEPAKMALDTICQTPTIAVERYAVAVTAAKWEMPVETIGGR